MANLSERHIALLCRIFSSCVREEKVRSNPEGYLLGLLEDLASNEFTLQVTARYANLRAKDDAEMARRRARVKEFVSQIVWMKDGFGARNRHN